MRRQRYHRSYHPRPYHHRRYRGPFGPWLLVLGAALLAGGMAVVVTLVTLLMTLAPLLLAGAATAAFVSARRRRGRSVTQRPRQAVERPAPASAPDWAAARVRFDQLRGEYAAFECDPLAVLRLPALTDVTVPSTGRFVDAFAEAQALQTDTEPRPAHRDRFVAAVDSAWRAWRAALEAAERIRLAGIPAQERATVQRAIKLLTMARDSDHDAERITAYAKARVELAKLERTGTVRLPPAAAAVLEAAGRGQLPPAPVAH